VISKSPLKKVRIQYGSFVGYDVFYPSKLFHWVHMLLDVFASLDKNLAKVVQPRIEGNKFL
jgi:hypothetical protein